MSISEDKLVGCGWHHTYGWLRRPEEDNHYGYAYEEPMGDLIFSPLKKHKKMAFLNCWIDGQTGEKFLAFSKATKLKKA